MSACLVVSCDRNHYTSVTLYAVHMLYALWSTVSDNVLTTIRISKEVRDDLAKLGSKNETYDTIIRRLLNEKRVEQGSTI
jgi:hypothetical protein